MDDHRAPTPTMLHRTIASGVLALALAVAVLVAFPPPPDDRAAASDLLVGQVALRDGLGRVGGWAVDTGHGDR